MSKAKKPKPERIEHRSVRTRACGVSGYYLRREETYAAQIERRAPVPICVVCTRPADHAGPHVDGALRPTVSWTADDLVPAPEADVSGQF